MNSKTYESERAVLGCVTLFPELFGKYVPQLSMDLFTSDSHRDTYQAILSAYKKTSGHYDQALIISGLKDADSRVELISCCQGYAFRATNISAHLQALQEAAQQRFIREQIEYAMIDDSLTPSKLQEIHDVAVNGYAPDTKDYGADYDRYLTSLSKPVDALYTRFSNLDRLVGGLRRGTLTIIGARPSVGKTTLALNIVQNIVSYGRTATFFSLEMTADMIFEKLAMRGCRIDSATLHHQPDENTRRRVSEYFENSGAKSRLSVIDDMSAVENICGHILSKKPDVAVIDYAQIVQTLRREENTRVKIDYISAQLKQTAKRTGCRVILLSQLRRPDSSATKPKPPTMADLKESSGLEQDGDYIFLLSRPYAQDKSYDSAQGRYIYPPNEAKLLIEKNKFGSTGMIDLNFDGTHQDFTEVHYER